MKTLVLFYSYSGHTKAVAEEFVKNEPADMVEIKDVKRPGKFKVYTAGIFASIGGKPWPAQPLGVDLSAYNKIILLSPVWANNPPPAVNAILAQLPENCAVSVKMVSASGKSACKDRLEAVIKAKNGTLEGFEDIQAKR